MTTLHKRVLALLLLLSIFFLTGCSQTSVSGIWKKSDYTGKPFTSILVVGLTGDLHNRILWENVIQITSERH
jgi:PBP1b-binding outer membrane lipoprotein LpoB